MAGVVVVLDRYLKFSIFEVLLFKPICNLINIEYVS